MSIFPVRLSKWFPPNPNETYWPDFKEKKNWNAIARACVSQSLCSHCGKKLKYRTAWGLHSIPWGYGWDELWCSERCLTENIKSRSKKT